MTSLRLYALALSATALAIGPAAGHPIVPGFERFHTGPDANPAVGGHLLLGELNCVSCHTAEGQTKSRRRSWTRSAHGPASATCGGTSPTRRR